MQLLGSFQLLAVADVEATRIPKHRPQFGDSKAAMLRVKVHNEMLYVFGMLTKKAPKRHLLQVHHITYVQEPLDRTIADRL